MSLVRVNMDEELVGAYVITSAQLKKIKEVDRPIDNGSLYAALKEASIFLEAEMVNPQVDHDERQRLIANVAAHALHLLTEYNENQ